MSVCTSCGTALETGAKFCVECGTSVRAPGSRATFGPRYAAFLVDITAVLGLWFVASIIARPFARLYQTPDVPGVDLGPITAVVGALLSVVLIPVVALIYFAIANARGHSVGKKIVKVRVRRLTGTRPGPIRGVVRAGVVWGPLALMVGGQIIAQVGSGGVGAALARFGAATFLLVWAFNIATAMFSRGRRGLHDLAAGTEVVIE